MLRELLKCDIYCANCHLSLHVMNERNIKIKDALLALKGIDKCSGCAHDGLALNFHHRDPAVKEFSFGNVVGRKLYLPVDVILTELDKCDVLCNNCHLREHFDHVRYKKWLPTIEKKIREYKECPVVDRAIIEELVSDGYSINKISKMVGCARSTVLKTKRQLKQAGREDKALVLKTSGHESVPGVRIPRLLP